MNNTNKKLGYLTLHFINLSCYRFLQNMDYQLITLHRNLIYTTFRNLLEVVQSNAKNMPPIEVLNGSKLDEIFEIKKITIAGKDLKQY